MKPFWFVGLLVFVVRSKARIINGTGEVCDETVCGYGANCLRDTCKCLIGFSSKIRTNTNPAVEYCLEPCTDGCPSGTSCTSIPSGNKRCMCNTDNGYVRSSLGACVDPETTTKNVQPTITYFFTKVPERTGPSTGIVISIVFNGVLVALVIILVIFLFRQRRHVRKTSNQNIGHGLDVAPAGDNSVRHFTDIQVISPAYENSVAHGIQSSPGNDNRMVQTSNDVNTAMYADIVDSNYVNTTDPSSDYAGLQVGQLMEQVEYEKLQKL